MRVALCWETRLPWAMVQGPTPAAVSRGDLFHLYSKHSVNLPSVTLRWSSRQIFSGSD